VIRDANFDITGDRVENVRSLFVQDSGVNLGSVHTDRGGSLNADLNSAWTDVYDGDFDSVANDNRFAGPTGEY